MTTVPIDLTKNPDVAALIADMEPGRGVCLYATIKSKDDQTAVFRLEECDEWDKPSAEDDEEGEEMDEAPPPPPEKPSRRIARKMESAASDNGMG